MMKESRQHCQRKRCIVEVMCSTLNGASLSFYNHWLSKCTLLKTLKLGLHLKVETPESPLEFHMQLLAPKKLLLLSANHVQSLVVLENEFHLKFLSFL
jgi:hypothetical protein